MNPNVGRYTAPQGYNHLEQGIKGGGSRPPTGMNGSAGIYPQARPPATATAPMGMPQPELKYDRTMLSIDSVDRDYYIYPSPSKYIYKLPTAFRNVVAIRLLSMEIPASFYVFRAEANNTTLLIKEPSAPTFVKATIADGNYTFPELAAAVQDAIIAATGNTTYTVTVNPNTLKFTISNTTNEFRIDTATGALPQGLFWGLGYNLGFKKGIYVSSGKSLTGVNIGDINPYNYMILDLGGDLNMIQEGDVTKGFFAKVPLNVNNFDYVYLTPECCSYNVARYDPPIGRLDTIPVLWRFHDGTQIDFNGFEHSFMIEIITGEGRLSHPDINRLTGAGSH
jgi:hypothetical protein